MSTLILSEKKKFEKDNGYMETMERSITEKIIRINKEFKDMYKLY